MSDPASLQNLNDIVTPDPVAWWPPAPGWYLVGALLLLVLVWLVLRQWRRWRQNAYRRQALAELTTIRSASARLDELPELLKRTALSVWPRKSVAGLSGAAWHRFLDDAAGMDRFGGGAGEILDRLAYGGRDDGSLSQADTAKLLDAAELWLKQHRLPAGDG